MAKSISTPKIRVWGTAAGRGTTADAAPGAFTIQEYDTTDYPEKDWRTIITVEQIKGGE
jgi:hypothetical protein